MFDSKFSGCGTRADSINYYMCSDIYFLLALAFIKKYGIKGQQDAFSIYVGHVFYFPAEVL